MKKEELKLCLLEEFYSIQGEGLYAGRPTLFIRLQGCDLCCTWCDTDHGKPSPGLHPGYEVPESLWWTTYPDGIRIPHICITGGEPLLQQEALCRWIAEFMFSTNFDRKHIQSITIETGGGQDIRKFKQDLEYAIAYERKEAHGLARAKFQYFFDATISICVDYKLSSSGQTSKMLLDNFHSSEVYGLSEDDCVKFVIQTTEDLKEAFEAVALFGFGYTNVFFSPCWSDEIEIYLDRCTMIAASVVEWNSKFGWNDSIGISLQTHKLLQLS